MASDADVTIRRLVLALLRGHVSLYGAVAKLTIFAQVPEDQKKSIEADVAEARKVIEDVLALLDKHNAG